jgi:hypothetical protein
MILPNEMIDDSKQAIANLTDSLKDTVRETIKETLKDSLKDKRSLKEALKEAGISISDLENKKTAKLSGKKHPPRPKKNEVRHVYLVLSAGDTMLQRTVRLVKRDQWTHASISIDKELTMMFSFARRWDINPVFGCFKHESFSDKVYRSSKNLKGIIVEFDLTLDQWQNIVDQIEGMIFDAHLYGYNYRGMIENYINRDFVDPKRFFCSEFVYWILVENGVMEQKVCPNRMRPQTLLGPAKEVGRVIFEGDIRDYI